MCVLLNSHMARFVCRSFPQSWVVRAPLSVKSTRNTPLPFSLCRQMVQVHENSPGNKRAEMKNISLKPAAPAKSSCCSRSWPYLLHANSVYQLFCHQFFDVTGCWRCLQYTRYRMLCLKQSYFTLHSVSYSAVFYSLYIPSCIYVCMYVRIYTCTLFIYSFSV